MKYTTAILGFAALAAAVNVNNNDNFVKRNSIVAVTTILSTVSEATPTPTPNSPGAGVSVQGSLSLSGSASASGSGSSGADAMLPRGKGMAYLMTGMAGLVVVGAWVI
jgi:hypothetical protein